MKATGLLLFVLLLLIAGCGSDDEPFCTDVTNPGCPNFDVCTRQPPATSDFKIVIGVRRMWADTLIDLEVDTVYPGSKIFFTAQNPYMDRYIWTVGDDPRTFDEQDVNLTFTNYTGDLNVRLVTEMDSSSTCLEPGQFRDEQSQQVHFVPRSRPSPMLGTFRGTIEGDPVGAEYEVTVNSHETSPWQRVRNLPLPSDCDFNGRGIPVDIGYQNLLSVFVQEGPTPRCRDLIVIGRLNPEDSDEVRFDYVYDDDDGSRKEVAFVGRRVR